MRDAYNDEDLRKLFASQLLDEINFLHADIVLVQDGDQHGCLSINILRENETFVEQTNYCKPIYYVKDYIENDIAEISALSNMTPEVIEARMIFLPSDCGLAIGGQKVYFSYSIIKSHSNSRVGFENHL